MAVLTCSWGHMHYRTRGPEAGLPIVLLNSLGTDLRMWEAVVDRLPQIRCIGLDARGHGLSSTPLEPWSIADLAGDVLALMDHLQIPKALIGGCSVGGLIAQALAASKPQRVAGLFLSDTAAKFGTPEAWQARIEAVEEGGIAAVAGPVLERWFAPAFLSSPEVGPWATMLVRGDPQGYIGGCRALAEADNSDRTTTIRCPTLFLGGSADLSTPPDAVKETAALIPGARVEILEGSGHIPAIDNPDRVAELLSAFHAELA